jgi:hypothetical protein
MWGIYGGSSSPGYWLWSSAAPAAAIPRRACAEPAYLTVIARPEGLVGDLSANEIHSVRNELDGGWYMLAVSG